MNITDLQRTIINAERIQIVGNNSRLQSSHPALLTMSSYAGVLQYHPEELVITVKAGTTINDIKQILADKGQALTFASSTNDKATIGGAYAIGNADLRDAILGVKIINGEGKVLNFGGQVMKNVAGYDVSRLLVGSRGKLAAICEISFKVLPQQYVTQFDQMSSIRNASSFVENIERGLKTIFDPNDVFA
jgi:glycolate oxidase FAD binding subunit